MRLSLADLERYCLEREEESLKLEFKSCNELRPGAHRRGNGNQSREDVVRELSRDVSSFLNASGGTIIYGIRESNSRAKELDSDNVYATRNDPATEKLTQWLRSHIDPAPTVDVYRIFASPRNSSWFMVVDIPQGEQAYMAKDKRFYKRLGNTTAPMEQYEVADVMNRARAAALAVRLSINNTYGGRANAGFTDIRIHVEVTSANYVASEYGAIKFLPISPLEANRDAVTTIFQDAQLDADQSLVIAGRDYCCQSFTVHWGANKGNIVFPGHWYNFRNNCVHLQVPTSTGQLPNDYHFKVELFTMHARKKERYFRLRRSGESYGLEDVDENQIVLPD